MNRTDAEKIAGACIVRAIFQYLKQARERGHGQSSAADMYLRHARDLYAAAAALGIPLTGLTPDMQEALEGNWTYKQS